MRVAVIGSMVVVVNIGGYGEFRKERCGPSYMKALAFDWG